MRGFLQMKYCCCGYSLRTGTIIIGYLGVFIQALLSLVAIIYIVGLATDKIKLESDAEYDKETMYGVMGLMAILGFGYAIASIVLLFGVYKRKPKLIHPYVYVNLVWIIVHILLTCLCISQNYYGWFLCVTFLGLEIYCFLVVNSYYCAMANEPIL